MKRLLITIFFISSFSLLAQEITLNGIVADTTNGKSNIHIQIKGKKNKYESANRDGSFKIKAFPKDSIIFTSNRHIRKAYKVSELVKLNRIEIKLEAGGCEEYISCEKKPKLYVFIGKKIKVNEYVEQKKYCDIISMDSKFEAKYEIIESIYGDYPNKIIEFEGYEHGVMSKSFYDYKYVLLYVGDYCGTLTHIKYQYDPLYKTKDGKWASPYNYYEYRRLKDKNNITPEKIAFKKNLKFKIPQNAYYKDSIFKEPYYEIKNNNAIAKYGNYPKELFELKKLTALKEFGFELEKDSK